MTGLKPFLAFLQLSSSGVENFIPLPVLETSLEPWILLYSWILRKGLGSAALSGERGIFLSAINCLGRIGNLVLSAFIRPIIPSRANWDRNPDSAHTQEISVIELRSSATQIAGSSYTTGR